MTSAPTDPKRMKEELARLCLRNPGYKLCGTYGDHLKAVVEAFVSAASALLQGPTYKIRERGAGKQREVPRMAFRVEIVDEFRIDGLAREVYRDLVRYGLFMLDNRGKSVRHTFVPRLFLRRLLLPYCTLALSKRDSVPLSCAMFTTMLLEPDAFKKEVASRRTGSGDAPDQLTMSFALPPHQPDPMYDDLLFDADAESGSIADEFPEGDGDDVEKAEPS